MTLATRLLLLIALALTPPLLSGIINDVMQRQERQAELQKNAIAESQSLQDNLTLVARGVHHLLVALASSPAIQSDDAAVCTTYLRSIASRFQEFTLLSAIDGAGNVRCNSIGSAPGSYSVADRAYFTRAVASNKFSGGDLVTGIVTARHSLHFALPVTNAPGAVARVVVASIGQDWLSEQLATESAPEGALVMMVDPAGLVVAAAQDGRPVTAPWIGQPASPELLRAMNLPKSEVFELTGPDGRTRLFGAVPPSPALAGNTAIVGLDRDQAFTDLRAASVRNILGLAAGAVIALLAGLVGARRFVLRPLARLAKVADRVGAGDLGARIDLGRLSGEMRELGTVFARMTAALSAREAERDTAEAARHRGEARLRFALEASSQGAFECDLRSRAVRRSETVAAIFGFGPDQGLVIDDYLARIVPEDLAQARSALGAGIDVGRVMASFRIASCDGEQRFVTSRGEVTRDIDGNPSLIGLLADETERYDNISALRESEARFQAIVDCIDQMVWSTRPNGFHDYFNQRWYDYTGATPGTGLGKSWRDLFHPDDQQELLAKWHEALRTGQPYYQEFRLRHVTGRYRWVLGRAEAIRDEQGRIVRWYGTCTDIDDIVQAREVLARSSEALTQEVADRTAELTATEEQLRQSQKMEAVGQLTGGIAHDFNNMLQAIGGALELLVRRVDQDKLDDAKRFAGIARTTVDRAASLTQRLLAFARRQTLTPEAADTAALLDGMSELISRTVGPAIDLVVQHDGDVRPVLCDISQLENVILNLCINARDAMPGGGRLIIGTANVSLPPRDPAQVESGPIDRSHSGGHVEISVTDTGSGMDEATQARAFEPFFTTKPLGQGTGLGLSQVYGFVHQSGGFVRLESELGHGTTVRLLLPCHTPAAEPAGNDHPVILLVKDDAQLREATAHHLRALGFTVSEGADGAAAVDLLERGLPRLDLLVTDVALEGPLNGRQLAETARRRRKDLPVLFITFYAGALEKGDLEPGMSVVAKPIEPEALAERVRLLLSS